MWICVFVALMLVSMISGKAVAATAKMAIAPSEVTDIASGETFTVNVTISDVTNLYGWQFNITFDPNVLRCEKAAEGPFLSSVNTTMYPAPKIDNDKGYVMSSSLFWIPWYPPQGASGSGLLANVTFTVKSGGSTSLHFDSERTYLRTVKFPPLGGDVQAITDFSAQDGSFKGTGGGAGLAGIPFEIVAAVVVVVVVVVGVAGAFYLKRRRQ